MAGLIHEPADWTFDLRQAPASHPTSEAKAIDRCYPWFRADSNGHVHVMFYDTANSSSWTGVGFYRSRLANGSEDAPGNTVDAYATADFAVTGTLPNSDIIFANSFD